MRLRAGPVAVALALVTAAASTTALVGLPSSAPSAPSAAGLPSAPAPVQEQRAAPAAAVAPRPLPVPVRVAPLGALRTPDLLVRLPRSVTPAQLAALRKVKGVTAVATLDLGSVPVAGRRTAVAGVDPSALRAFTPRETAASDPLWASIARGELAPTYGWARTAKVALASTQPAAGTELRVGALAVFGLPSVDALTSRASAQALGLPRDNALLVAAPTRSAKRLTAAVRDVLGTVTIDVLRPVEVSASKRPATYRELYIQSARYCPGLRWQVLAAIGQVESGHGQNNGPSSAGALGPMQFLPLTWQSYGVDGDGDGKADIMSPYDAVPAAALYLCRYGAGRGGQDLYDAIFAYNRLDSYVQKVLGLAAAYR